MKKTEVIRQLESLGNERFRRTFARHGVTGKAFGVPYADLYELERRIGTDQKLAEALWSSGIHDARVLAARIADPETIKASTLDAWVGPVSNELVLQAVAGVAAKCPTAPQRMRKWMKAKQEWVCATGWAVAAALVATDRIDDDEVDAMLERIEATIHDRPDRVKHTMNTVLISIGARDAAFTKKAIAAAKRVGKVDVDHGDTSCKTPDAVAYIRKMADRKKKKATKKKVTRKKTAARR